MMGRQTGNQSQLFYLFNLERRIPADHLLRRINPVVTGILVEVREQLAPFYSDMGWPSVDPRACDPNADRRLLLWHPLREAVVRRARTSPCVPVVVATESGEAAAVTISPSHDGAMRR